MKVYNFKIAFLLIVLIFVISNRGNSQILAHKNYTHRDGLSLNSTWALKEKKDGGILIGTQGDGILEFDGYNFKKIIPNNKNENHHITGIETHNEDIFFTSRYLGVFKINQKEEVSLVFSDKNSGDYLDLFIFEKYILTYTEHSIYIYNLNTNKNVHSNFTNTKDLKISEVIKTSEEVVFLTNKGNFVFTTEGKFIALQKYFKSNIQELDKMKYGYFLNNNFHLLNGNLTCGYKINLNGKKIKIENKTINKHQNLKPFSIVSTFYNDQKKCFVILSNDGIFFEEENFSIRQLPDNKIVSEINPVKAICDYKGDYWVSSFTEGVFKISSKPFIKLNFHPQFLNSKILFVHKTPKDNIILSMYNQEVSYSGKMYSGELKSLPIKIITGTTYQEKVYLGTNHGLYSYDDETNSIQSVHIPQINNKHIQFVHLQPHSIWINVYNEGLYQFDENFNLIKHFNNQTTDPKIIYTGQFTTNGEILYVGTPDGVKKLNIKKGVFSSIKSTNLGYYSGHSTKDIFGINWFTLDHGLLGINDNGEQFEIKNKNLFPSKLFYTLNSDNYGNLIIGTNQGLNIIQVNEKGTVLNQRNFDSGTGFDGYETNMRASFQDKKSVLIGSVEGLYMIDFQSLNNITIPLKPMIYLKEKIENFGLPVFKFQFISKNPKLKDVRYSYRIIGKNTQWSELKKETELSISSLKKGTYILEVKASIDGINFSPISQYTFEVNQTLFRGNITIISLLLLTIILLAVLFFQYKKKAADQLFYSDDFFFIQKYTSRILIFAGITHIILNEITTLISNDLIINHFLSIGIVFFLLFVYLAIQNPLKKGHFKTVSRWLIISFYVFQSYYFYSFYENSLHPYFGFSIIILCLFSAFILEKTLIVIIYSICVLFITLFVITFSFVEYFDKYLLILPLIIACLISIYITIIRNDSILKLSFLSSSINKSNMIAIAIDENNTLKYVSENINSFIDFSISELINSPISILNGFLPEGYNEVSFTENLHNEKPFVIPIVCKGKNIHWYEWSIKEFNQEVKILIGNNITEKINLKNTYEILVENAEDLIYQIDTKGLFVFANNRFNDYISENKDSLIGHHVSKIIPDDYFTEFNNHYKTQLDKKTKVSYYEFPIINHKGDLQWFGQYVTLLFSFPDKNEVIGFLAVGRNITEKKHKDSIILSQQTDLNNSIEIAKKTLRSQMPKEEILKEIFGEIFILQLQKQNISGDFYWSNQVNDYTIIVLGDTSSQGVRSSFSSILLMTTLNAIVTEKKIHNPGRILDELDARLKNTIHEFTNNLDEFNGFKITICTFNDRTNSIEYASAGALLLLHDGTSFSLRKGDSKLIGDYNLNNFQQYVTHHSNIEQDTTVYLFSDGLQNQQGGVINKRYSLKRLIELLSQNISLPMKNQKEMINLEIDNWIASSEQNDDITLIGIRKHKNKPNR